MNPSEKLMEDAREEYARKGVLRQEYHRGYEAGKRARTPEQWQLDMERMEVARRVDAVTLDKGSHGNLSAIASAIYEPEFGWTSGACAMLRDKLVRLLGGAHERDCRGGRDDTGASRADNSDGEQAEEVNLLDGDEPTLSDLGGVWKDEEQPQDDTLMRVSLKAKTYAYQILELADILGVDVKVGDNVPDIGNEVITKARQLTDECNFSTPENDMDAEDSKPNPAETLEDASDHVSFGTRSDTNGTMGQTNGTCPNDVPIASITNERHKAVCELRKVCTELDASVWTWIEDVAIAIGAQDGPNDEYESMLPKIICRLIHLLGGDEPNFSEIAKTINLGDESDSELMENGESHKIASITDELRECVDTAAKSYDNTPWYDMSEGEEADHTICYITEGELMRIADRIDEQFDRICEQHERVLQSTIDDMCDELSGLEANDDELEANNAELTAKFEALMAANADLAKGIDDARESEYRAERQRDELQAKLDEIAGVLDGRD